MTDLSGTDPQAEGVVRRETCSLTAVRRIAGMLDQEPDRWAEGMLLPSGWHFSSSAPTHDARHCGPTASRARRADAGSPIAAAHGPRSDGALGRRCRNRVHRVSRGLEMTYVPYRGEPPAMTDLIAGRIHAMVATPGTGVPHVRDGKIRALVTGLQKRSPVLPDVPTIGEAGFPDSTSNHGPACSDLPECHATSLHRSTPRFVMQWRTRPWVGEWRNWTSC